MSRSERPHPTPGADPFFDRFRSAVSRLPAGLIRVAPPATHEAIAAVEQALGRPLPGAYALFLRSFDGADLFHESILIAGVSDGVTVPLLSIQDEQSNAGELMFAEGMGGDRFAFDRNERVIRHDPGADERIIAGSDFTHWLDATIAREQLLFDRDGEYAPEVFDPSGEEVLPTIALRQAERALRADPGSADAAHARGLALVRLGRRDAAMQSFLQAITLDPTSPWPFFDLGRAALAAARPRQALDAFEDAAACESPSGGGRILAWAVRAAVAAGDNQRAETLRARAQEADPTLVEGLRRALDAAERTGDDEARAEAAALIDAVQPSPSPAPPPRRRLPVITTSSEPAAPPPRREPPRRPRPAAPRRSGGSPRGSRR